MKFAFLIMGNLTVKQTKRPFIMAQLKLLVLQTYKKQVLLLRNYMKMVLTVLNYVVLLQLMIQEKL